MATDYYIYHTETGECISKDRWAGLSVLFEKNNPYVHMCIAKTQGSCDYLTEWTTDKESELWKNELKKPYYCRDDGFLYCSKEDVLNIQKLMPCNKTALEEIMNKHNSDGLIIGIFQ